MSKRSAPRLIARVEDERSKVIRPILRALEASSNEIEATAAISSDGLCIASVMDESVDPDRFCAMSAALLALAESVAQEVYRGKLKLVMIEGESGNMMLVQAGPDAVLALAARPSCQIGKVFLDARRSAERIAAKLDGVQSAMPPSP